MAFRAPREVVPSAARTTTGTSTSVDVGDFARALNLVANVTSATGTTPTLDLTVEWSHDGGTTWAAGDPSDAFTQITAAGAKVRQVVLKAPAYRLRWTIAGTTPSFTFAVSEYLT